MWKTRRNSFEDARGNRHLVLPIKAVLKLSGLKRSDLIRKEDLMSFWKLSLFFGLFFAIVMRLVRVLTEAGLAWYLGRTRLQPLFEDGWVFEFFVQFMVFGGIMGAVISRMTWRSPQHAKSAMLRAGICPACRYQIDQVPVGSDGCTVCPECGSVWRLSS